MVAPITITKTKLEAIWGLKKFSIDFLKLNYLTIKKREFALLCSIEVYIKSKAVFAQTLGRLRQ